MGMSRDAIAQLGPSARAQIEAELARAAKPEPAPAAKSKYGNHRVTLPTGETFDSKSEARRFLHLRAEQDAGRITGLECQPSFPLVVNGRKCATYRADFRYVDATGKVRVEDVKGGVVTGKRGGRSGGSLTPEASLKIKIAEALFDLTVEITTA